MTNHNRWFLIAASVFLASGTARAQQEQDWPSRNPELASLAAFTAVTTDITFTACALGQERPDQKLATLEIVLTAPQVGVLIWEGAANPSNLNDRTRVLLLAVSAWPAALTLHGAWSLVRGESPGRVAARTTWGLTFVGDGNLGFGATGRF
jgi:hypothetical protein